MDYQNLREYVQCYLPRYSQLIAEYLHALRDRDEKRLLMSLVALQSSVGATDVENVRNVCIKEAVRQEDSNIKRVVVRFFGYDDSFVIPVEVTFRRKVEQETAYSGFATVSIDDLAVGKDGTLVIFPWADYKYEKGSLKKIRESVIDEREAKYDDRSSTVVAWKKGHIAFKQRA